MWLRVRSTRRFANRASAYMLMPITIAATAITPMTENQMRRRMVSVRLSLFDQHCVEEQPEADEGGEEDQVAQADHAAREVLEAVDHCDTARDLGECRRVAREEIGDDGIGRDSEHEADRDAKYEGDYLVLGQRRERGAHRKERAGN